nr:hypothetical protein [Tanacetum cinerariifolium]
PQQQYHSFDLHTQHFCEFVENYPDLHDRVCDMGHASALDFALRESQTSAILAAIEVEIERSLDGLSLCTYFL